MIIRTIAGDLEPSELGQTNYHEHAFQISPLLAGDELSDLTKSSAEFTRLKKSGFDSYVDATPIGLGRRVDLISEVGARSGLNVVHTTGVHKEAHYRSGHAITDLSLEQLRDLFAFEIQEGFITDDNKPNSLRVNSQKLRAGLIKFGVSSGELTNFESNALEAAAEISIELGVAIMVHTEGGELVHEVLDRLERLGCDLSRVAIAHLDRKPELSLHKAVASRGALIGQDGAGRTKYWPDETLISLFEDICNAGFASKILLGSDVGRSTRYIEYGGAPGLEYLGNEFIPRLIQATSQEIVTKVLTQNPQNWLAFTP